MRYAIDIAPLGELADPATIVRLAVAAEAAGWDGLSCWDSLGASMGASAADPFVALGAVASATTRLRLIASVIVLPRRRPQLVAQAAATLDRWSNGRLVLGVGTGGDPGDLGPFGDPDDAAERVRLLDEGVERIDAWLRGEPARMPGGDVDVRVGPRPIQEPRPPIWVGAMRPGGLRRAAAWDGWIAIGVAPDGSGMALTADVFGALVNRVREARASAGRAADPFDIAVFGVSEPAERDIVAGFAKAGATWWLESLSPMRGSVDELLARIAIGPPR